MNEKRDDKLTAAARQLATGIKPQRDLWPGIERAIAESAGSEPRRSRWTPMFAQAAAIVLLVGASSGLTYLAVKNDKPVVITQQTPEYTFERASFGSSYTLGRDYLETRADVVAKSIDHINSALLQHPDNTLLQDLLMKTYHEELNVMRKVGGVTQSVMSRRDI
jgi:hypothetical protein